MKKCILHIQYINNFIMFTNTEINDQILSQVMVLTDQNNNLYQLDVQVSQKLQEIQNQQNVSLKCLEQYIAQIQQNLQKKYQNTNIQQTDTNSIHFTKRKRIKKIKIKQFKVQILDIKIKRCKVYLNRLWARRLFHFLKGKFNKYAIFKKINPININELSKVFQQNKQIGAILEKQKENFLNFIYEQKINDQTKLILYQTFDILLEGTKHPESLDSWDLQLNRNIKESKQLLMKFKDKSYQEIYQLALLQYQRQKEHYQSNKCSIFNNLGYFWFKYLKDVFESEDFKSLYQSRQVYRRLQFTFAQPATIMNIRTALSIKQLAQYILKSKIESKQILSQLVLNNKINLLNKINMIMTLNQFINAVKNPSSLSRWI